LNENGKLVEYSDSPDDYLPNIVKSRALDFIQKQSTGKPFFAMLSLPSCHAPFTPEEKYKNHFSNLSAPRTRNFNVGAEPFKKHWLMTMELPDGTRELPDDVIKTVDEFYRKRLQTLQTVDDIVEEIVLQLNKQKMIDETYIIFTSDHGYHLGQWAMPFDKRLPYETDIRVPLIIRGPNIGIKTVVASPIMLIDLAPTIFNWAKIPIDYDDFDGKPFDQLLTSYEDKIEERQMLVEYWGEGNVETWNNECSYNKHQRLSQCNKEMGCKCQDSWNNTYSCVRHMAEHINFMFCMFQDREHYQEAYDLDSDFYQLDNVGFEILPSQQAQYQIMVSFKKKSVDDILNTSSSFRLKVSKIVKEIHAEK
jgi:N-acetylglucosamine-6-sulfatase